MGKALYHSRFVPLISPLNTDRLLFTIVVMFSLKGNLIITLPLDVVRIAIPLLIYFCGHVSGVFLSGEKAGRGLLQTTTLAFTAASKQF